uniref:tetratricopeptide repeat protein n=1 Tax=Alistipes sp. TaxID=1872444 RepID=UPI00405749BE
MKRLSILLLLLLSMLQLRAQEADTTALATTADQLTPEALWDKANTAYLRSDYHTAHETYEEILARGLASAKLYYNLGNAYFKEGNMGRAILNYHRALRLKPGDEDILHNLAVAEKQTVDRIESIPSFFLVEWMRALGSVMSGRMWTILSLLLFALSLALLLLFLLSQRMAWRKWGFYGTLLSFILFIMATLFATADRRRSLKPEEAVILSSAVSVKSSPDGSATDLFLLHEGTLVKLGEEIDGWTEITLADGKKGWLELRHMEII